MTVLFIMFFKKNKDKNEAPYLPERDEACIIAFKSLKRRVDGKGEQRGTPADAALKVSGPGTGRKPSRRGPNPAR